MQPHCVLSLKQQVLHLYRQISLLFSFEITEDCVDMWAGLRGRFQGSFLLFIIIIIVVVTFFFVIIIVIVLIVLAIFLGNITVD